MIEDMKNLLLIASLFGTPLLGGCSKDPEIVKPEIIANSVTVLEGKSAEVNANISITLSESIQEDILLGYSTEDLTAKSGKDYTGIEDGVLTIPSGSTSATLSIPLLQDDLLEFTEIFRVIFVRPANATLRNERILVNIEDNDIIAITSKIVALSQGRIVKLKEVNPSDLSRKLSKKYNLDPEYVELIIQEADEIYGGTDQAICTLKEGVMIANAGIDRKNVPLGISSPFFNIFIAMGKFNSFSLSINSCPICLYFSKSSIY